MFTNFNSTDFFYFVIIFISYEKNIGFNLRFPTGSIANGSQLKIPLVGLNVAPLGRPDILEVTVLPSALVVV